MRFALDSNILVYAIDSETLEKHSVARRIVERSFLSDSVLVTQTLCEFLNVVIRKYPDRLSEAQVAAELWAELWPAAESTRRDAITAVAYATRYRLQYWDSFILAVARSSGAEILLSEDMQDGLILDGITVIDPFNPANAALLDTLLSPIEEIDRQ